MKPPPEEPLLPPLRPIYGLSVAVAVLLGIWVVVELSVVAVDIWRVSLLSKLQRGPDAVVLEALHANDALYGIGGVLQSAVYVAAAVVFLVWLFRARSNAERANFTRHRRSRPWLILGWGVPVVSLWFPKQIVDDIWRASEPRTPLGGADLDSHPKPVLVYPWWACWLVFTWLANAVWRVLWGTPTLEEVQALKWAAIIEVVAAPVGIAAAVLAEAIVWRISGFQEGRRAAQQRHPHLVPGGAS